METVEETVVYSQKVKESLQKIRIFLQENKLVLKRTDDDYLYRFYAGHEMDVEKTIEAIKFRLSFIDEYFKTNWYTFNTEELRNLYQKGVLEVLNGEGKYGQVVVWFRFCKWNPSKISLSDALRVSTLLTEAVYYNRNINNIQSVDFIFDPQGLTFKQYMAFTPRIAKMINDYLTYALPMKLFHTFFVRQPVLFNIIFALFKPLFSEPVRQHMHLCGNDFKILKEVVGEEILPVELGGKVTYQSERWFDIISDPKAKKVFEKNGYTFS